ncbi:hypothetical protein D5272_04430 [bacterium D16-76]|nr:hypothetical protein [bacterium D16-76]
MGYRAKSAVVQTHVGAIGFRVKPFFQKGLWGLGVSVCHVAKRFAQQYVYKLRSDRAGRRDRPKVTSPGI